MRLLYTLSTLAFAAAVNAADYQTVRDDIANISTILGRLEDVAKGIKPGSLGIARALQLEAESVLMHKTLLVTTADTRASPPFEEHSLDVGGDFLNMQPKVEGALQSVTDQKQNLGDLGVVVLACLYQLKQDTDILGKDVIAKLNEDFQTVAPQVLAAIIDTFNKAITAYGGKVA
ncbi:hypothetical protein K4F52_005221 [Lecanicillium sp. MT-2017a]|nr:hypothetical protein K4F52_005221 [Lecanicillium sp. MT-2017a]